MTSWNAIPSFPAYEASDAGEIRRAAPGPNTHAGKTLVTYRKSNGYRGVGICRGGKQICTSVHRLVCEAFHGRAPSAAHEVAHGDGDRANNTPSNLRWALPVENADDRRLHGRTVSKLTNVDVAAIRSAACGVSQRELGRRYGIDHTTVGRIIRREIWEHVA